MKSKLLWLKGILFATAGSVIYGVMPLLVSMIQKSGVTNETMIFFRTLITVPLYFVLIKWKKMSLKVSMQEFVSMSLLGIIGVLVTTVLLFTSYEFIPTGMATGIHFFYPVFVTIGGIIIYKEKTSFLKILALLSGLVGVIFLSVESIGGSALGCLLAFLSSGTYAFQLIYSAHLPGKQKHPFIVGFYGMVVAVVPIFIWGQLTDNFSIEISLKGWLLIFILAVLVTMGAFLLIYMAIQEIGSSTTAIIGVLELITSLIVGSIFLNEIVTVLKVIGAICTVVAVITVTLSQVKDRAVKTKN